MSQSIKNIGLKNQSLHKLQNSPSHKAHEKSPLKALEQKAQKQQIAENKTDTEDFDPDYDFEEPEDPVVKPERPRPQVYNNQGKLSSKAQKDNEEEVDVITEADEAPENQTEKPEVDVTLKDNDSFYSVIDRQNRFTEDPSGYFIEAYSPVQAQDHFKFSINNNKAIVSGSRKSENKLQDSERLMSTNNFQTFREEFTLEHPIQSQGMTRERNGDYIRIFIPKAV